MDYLSDLPRYVGPGHFQTVCDNKSGYDHICLSQSSRTLLGYHGKVVISFIIPSPLDGRQVPMFITPLVCCD